MEIQTTTSGEGQGVLDSELDVIGVRLEQSLLCGACGSTVSEKGSNSYFCGKCKRHFTLSE